MAGNIPPNREENSVATTRRSELVTVKVPIVSSDQSVACNIAFDSAFDEEKVIIQGEGCQATFGQLCVKKDSATSNNISIFVANPNVPPSEDASGKFIQYNVPIPDESRQREQPRCILLESQLKDLEKHFLHWNSDGPTVTFQPLNYESDVPHVNIKDEADQKFMWVIPLEKGNQISLKTYCQSYYLAFDCHSNPILRRGDTSNAHQNSVLEIREWSA